MILLSIRIFIYRGEEGIEIEDLAHKMRRGRQHVSMWIDKGTKSEGYRGFEWNLLAEFRAEWVTQAVAASRLGGLIDFK